MYVFEGHDYSKEPSDKDKSAFDELIAGKFLHFIFRIYILKSIEIKTI